MLADLNPSQFKNYFMMMMTMHRPRLVTSVKGKVMYTLGDCKEWVMRKHGKRKRDPHEPKAGPSRAPNFPEHSDDLNDDDPHRTPVKLPQQKRPHRPIVISDDEDDVAQEADPIPSSIPPTDLLQPALGMKKILLRKTPLPHPAARPASPPAVLPLATVAPSVPSSSQSQPQPPLAPDHYHDSYVQKIPSGPSRRYLPD
jgi:hypothetical protein